ncbi:MAG: hypothetical protein IJY12_04505 [Clostridia bacterium]|nr:hypothetical protein [Clostridia bacterium]
MVVAGVVAIGVVAVGVVAVGVVVVGVVVVGSAPQAVASRTDKSKNIATIFFILFNTSQ